MYYCFVILIIDLYVGYCFNDQLLELILREKDSGVRVDALFKKKTNNILPCSTNNDER
jgi:hypothetical protein